ncbi:hypothetical protein QOZ80_4BG0348520 [Eleusine coracana subsp. coracana]|nr:hypothetical protein QOZ80_4BG0348520 [Eleusine coracana subsp. coracana]
MPSPAASSPSPFPPPAPSATRRRRRLQLLPPSSSSSATTPTSTSGASSGTSSSSSGSSSSSASSGALSFFSPAPSPFHHRFLSPLRYSAVPFSWEHRPGIPKTPARQLARPGKSAAKALPLPPSLLSSKVGAADDPFVVSADEVAGNYFIVPEDAKTARRRRRRMQRRRRPPALAATLTDWLAMLSLYRSCTRSRDCLAAGTPPPRPRSPAKAAAA